MFTVHISVTLYVCLHAVNLFPAAEVTSDIPPPSPIFLWYTEPQDCELYKRTFFFSVYQSRCCVLSPHSHLSDSSSITVFALLLSVFYKMKKEKKGLQLAFSFSLPGFAALNGTVSF